MLAAILERVAVFFGSQFPLDEIWEKDLYQFWEMDSEQLWEDDLYQGMPSGMPFVTLYRVALAAEGLCARPSG